MAEVKTILNWQKQLASAIDPDKATKIQNRVEPSWGACPMCGKWCAFRTRVKIVKPTEKCA